MSLTAGGRLGRYEIVKPLGAGGMGEVYHARDTRLDRDVAIKILPESVARDPERLARFEREAKAVAALSHPNILALYDAGTEQGTTFAVMELLEGETLRERLEHGPLPLRRSIDTAIQIARGLGAAHAKGLVHRDLKPENIFLVGAQIKILDFGLAKAVDGVAPSGATLTQAAMTDPGSVVGTVGYMAPEQVRGQAVDARADLFALGAVLYEMIAGQRAFRRDTAAETMTAILREDPPDLPAPQVAQAPALDRIVRHCLEKNPAERFQSAHDVAFALEALSGSGALASGAAPAVAGTAPARLRPMLALGAAAAIAIAVVAGWLAGYIRVGSPTAGGVDITNIRYQPVTFDEGFVFAARFARDGRTIVYSADWENQPRDIFVTSLDSPGARALGYKGADLLAVSPDGALAILLDGSVSFGSPYFRRGTIARASLTGGAPKKELDQVNYADFATDGSLAVTRGTGKTGSKSRIEWPQGHAIVESDASSVATGLPNPRLSPSGAHVAFFDCRLTGCTVKIASSSGATVAESRPFFDWWGLAWAPGGREVWFAAAETSGRQCTLFALDVAGRQRMIFRAPGSLNVFDLSAEGRLLASFDQIAGRQEMRESPSSPPRDLSWKEGGNPVDVSANGLVLFFEDGDSGGAKGSVYLRRPADPEPVRISDGVALALSDDGSMALVRSHDKPLQISLVPTTGLPQPLDIGPIDQVSAAGWLKDGRLVLDLKRQPDQPAAVFVRPANGGPITPFLPAGIHLGGQRLFAPDGRQIAAMDESGRHVICTAPPDGTPTCAPMPGTSVDDDVAGWTADSRSVFVYRRYPAPFRVERVDSATGRRDLVTMLQPMTAAVSGLGALFVTPGGAMVYRYGRNRSAVYVISGLK